MNLTNRFTFRQLLWCPLLLIAIALVGCVDLAAIRRFADQAAETASYSHLTESYINQFDRIARYRKADRHAALAEQAQERRKLEQPLLGLQRGLVEYLNALATLASDQAITFDQSLKGLADEL